MFILNFEKNCEFSPQIFSNNLFVFSPIFLALRRINKYIYIWTEMAAMIAYNTNIILLQKTNRAPENLVSVERVVDAPTHAAIIIEIYEAIYNIHTILKQHDGSNPLHLTGHCAHVYAHVLPCHRGLMVWGNKNSTPFKNKTLFSNIIHTRTKCVFGKMVKTRNECESFYPI